MCISFKIFRSYVCILYFLLSASTIYAQQTSTSQDTTLVSKPAVIPVTDIIQNVKNIEEDFNLIRKKIEPKLAITKIDSLLPSYEHFIKKEQADAHKFITSNPNRQKIDNLVRKWGSYQNHLKKWEDEIDQNEERNIRLLERVEKSKEVWQLTYDNAKAQNITPSVIIDVQSVINDADKIITTIKIGNNELLNLESRISHNVSITADVLRTLNELKSSEVYKLLYLRHEPLWKTPFVSEDSEIKEQDLEAFSNNFHSILSYTISNENDIYIYVIILALLFFIIWYLKKGFAQNDFPDSTSSLLKAKNLISKKNWIISIYLGLIIARFFFDEAPKFLVHIIILSLLLVSIPLIKPILHAKFKRIVYFAIFFFILDGSKTYMWFSSSHYRIYLLFESLLVLAVVYHFCSPYFKTRRIVLGKLGTLLIKLVPIIYLLSITSIISNVLGFTNLADLSLKICTQIGAMIMMFYAVYLILEALTISIIHLRFRTSVNFDHSKIALYEHKALQFINFLVLFLWLVFFLIILDQFNPIIDFFKDVFAEPYKIGNTSFTIGALVSFAAILFISYVLTKLISFFIDENDGGVIRFLKLPKGVPAAISLVIRYFIICIGLIFAISALGFDLSKFNLMAGALGLGIGFGLQTVISNFVSGIILVFERPILIGDTVEVDNLLGTVSRIGVRSSSIITFDGAEVVVPNNNLMSNDLINWTLSNNIKRVEILVGTTYNSNPNIVLELLMKAAVQNEAVLSDPPPNALFTEFGESALLFKLRFWAHTDVGLQTKSDVSIAIYNLFKEHKVEIPFPQRDVHIKHVTKYERDTDNSLN